MDIYIGNAGCAVRDAGMSWGLDLARLTVYISDHWWLRGFHVPLCAVLDLPYLLPDESRAERVYLEGITGGLRKQILADSGNSCSSLWCIGNRGGCVTLPNLQKRTLTQKRIFGFWPTVVCRVLTSELVALAWARTSSSSRPPIYKKKVSLRLVPLRFPSFQSDDSA